MQGTRHKGEYKGTIASGTIGPLFQAVLDAVSSVTGHTSREGRPARGPKRMARNPGTWSQDRERIPSPLDLPPGAALRWGTTLPQPRRRARFGGPSVFLDPAHHPKLGSQ